jgi:hypothetical protein
VDAEDVIQVLDALDAAGVRHWVGGGWGVAALAGRQTRQHRDLDLNIDAADLGRCLAALGGLGYVAETDWLPSRIEVAAPGDRWVDVPRLPSARTAPAARRTWTAGSSSTRLAPSAAGLSAAATSGACRHASSAASMISGMSTGPRTSTTSPSSTPSPISKDCYSSRRP